MCEQRCGQVAIRHMLSTGPMFKMGVASRGNAANKLQVGYGFWVVMQN